ncbi:MAG: zf-HC2 domain-containing protein [Rubrivivax sp.]|nr:zf-HC2 domain-containing protein [Pyrinomonadaceae bacterium]
MNEKLNTTASNNGTRARGCDRAEQLVAYLYGETAPVETKVFRQHLTSCKVCRDEMAAFGGVRELVGEWRSEALGALPSLGIDESFATATAVRPPYARKRSAIAALREFFSLSPLWLRAGAVAATLVFCALAALTLARAEVRWDANGFAFNTGVKERIVEKEKLVQAPVSTGLSQEQVNARIVAARAEWDKEKNKQIEVMQANWKQMDAHRTAANSALASRPQGRKRTAPGNQQRIQQNLNEDVAGIDVFNTNEERVPRLTDLLGAVKTPRED